MSSSRVYNNMQYYRPQSCKDHDRCIRACYVCVPTVNAARSAQSTVLYALFKAFIVQLNCEDDHL